MPVEARLYTDPACPRCWGEEPKIQRLRWEFAEQLALHPVLGGLARTIDPDDRPGLVVEWLEAAERSGMPVTALAWVRNPISSTYPACQAVKAAAEQGPDAALRYLRGLREGLMVGARRLDHVDALVAEAGAAELDVERFEIDLRSHAVVEAFGADLEETRADERLQLPSVRFVAADGSRREVLGPSSYEDYRAAAIDAGASPQREERPTPRDAIDHFGRLATRELEELTGMPRPVLEAELWAAAKDWRLRPEILPAGTLWQSA